MAENFDAFKEQFKFFKRQKQIENLVNVLDFESICELSWQNLELRKVIPAFCHENTILEQKYGLLPLRSWKIYNIGSHPGFSIILNPFTLSGQKYWIQRCLCDYSKRPNPCNLEEESESIQDIWKESFKVKDLKKSLLWKLRWVTFGYNHNWNTKKYSESNKTCFPDDLKELCHYIALSLCYNNFIAEAAIINFYHLDHCLSGHVDNSELDVNSPLISFSFGQAAIFLLGDKSKDVKPDAILLRSGDIIIMGEDSRFSYHAVPRILLDKNGTIHHLISSDIDSEDWSRYILYLKESRINISVRQVLPEGCISIS